MFYTYVYYRHKLFFLGLAVRPKKPPLYFHKKMNNFPFPQ